MPGPVSHRQLDVNGIDLHVAEAGSGPPVILCHGFPELWYSWRHQLPALAEAGYHAIAPDMRGYGESSIPEGVDAYDLLTICDDLLGLLDDTGEQQGVFVGHDWGATATWLMAAAHPERVAAVAGLSVPFMPRMPMPPSELMANLGDDFYMNWLRSPESDAALARDVRRTLNARGQWDAKWAAGDDDPGRYPFMSEDDLQVYVDSYERTGFTGGLNWYRAMDLTWERGAHLEGRRVEQPALFLTGSRDPVQNFAPAEVMEGHVTDLRESVVIEGAGHWVQQERPDEVNEALLRFLREAGP